uniref:RPW8 domain-containing protein n=1 Tax=Picea sitchensis TaxID=3332 RepID=B8LNS7_PICSI|nr:unknown [Picea sitchensis]
MALFEAAAIQIAMEKGLKELGGVANSIISSKTWGEKLEETVSLLKPTIDEYIEITSYPDLSAQRSEQFKEFQAVLQSARDLVQGSDQIHSLDIKGMYDYGNKVLEFNKEIKDFIGIQGPPNLARDLQKLIADVRDLGRRFELMERLILQNINPTQLSQIPIDGIHGATAAQMSNSFNSQVPDMPNEVVGLYKPINDVKQILRRSDVNIVGITGMGGSGKTTLASALCNDPEVQASFQHNILFITVSQLHRNENCLFEILETMWDHIIGGHRPHFRSIEDARNQLQNNLKRIAERTYRPTLVVLDDVWSQSNLKNLLFTAEGYKTIITTRHNSTIPDIDGTRLYDMPVLEGADALSLFCFWAFSQTSIPATAKEDLVKQV